MSCTMRVWRHMAVQNAHMVSSIGARKCDTIQGSWAAGHALLHTQRQDHHHVIRYVEYVS